ncbi:MAG: hypothetical protein IPM53_30040 [Anaerolineaceae bacterium]|nr:hypothetical protein [Anaerolineaceae bacterium]
MLNVQERSGSTRKKTITLTDAGRAQIHAFAKTHQMTFSAAIETLALIGMEADLTALLIPLIHSSVERGMERQFNRIAKLGLLASAEAAMAHELTTMLLLQQIRQEATDHPQNFEDVMQVGQGDRTTRDGRIRAVYKDMRTVARGRQRALLRKPLRELVHQLQGEAVDVISDEEVETDE